MKKFIFRRPFIRKEDKLEGEIHISSANTWARISTDVLNTNKGAINAEYIDAVEKMLIHMEHAADCLGFKDTNDMLEYKSIHGEF